MWKYIIQHKQTCIQVSYILAFRLTLCNDSQNTAMKGESGPLNLTKAVQGFFKKFCHEQLTIYKNKRFVKIYNKNHCLSYAFIYEKFPAGIKIRNWYKSK